MCTVCPSTDGTIPGHHQPFSLQWKRFLGLLRTNPTEQLADQLTWHQIQLTAKSWQVMRLAWSRAYAGSGRLWRFDIWEAEQANEGSRDHSLCRDKPRSFTPSRWLMSVLMNSDNCERCVKLLCLCGSHTSHTMCTVWNTNEERKPNHDGEIHNIIVTIKNAQSVIEKSLS